MRAEAKPDPTAFANVKIIENEEPEVPEDVPEKSVAPELPPLQPWRITKAILRDMPEWAYLIGGGPVRAPTEAEAAVYAQRSEDPAQAWLYAVADATGRPPSWPAQVSPVAATGDNGEPDVTSVVLGDQPDGPLQEPAPVPAAEPEPAADETRVIEPADEQTSLIPAQDEEAGNG